MVETRCIMTAHTPDYAIWGPVTGDLMQRYADRCGATFLDVEYAARIPRPHWFILAVDDAMLKFDRVVWMDGDMLVNPEAPNLFEEVPRGFLGAFCDEGQMTAGEPDWRERPCYRHGYFNGGLLIFDSAVHTGMHARALASWRKRHEAYTPIELNALFVTQTAMNRIAHDELMRVWRLGAQWNHYLKPRHMDRLGINLEPRDCHVIHFAGGSQHTPAEKVAMALQTREELKW